MTETITEIIIHIKDLPTKEALIYLGLKGISDFVGAGCFAIKKIIVDKHNEGKYAFVPDKEELLFLKESAKSPQYLEISILVPNYKYISLISTGLLLKKYNNKISQTTEADESTRYKAKIGKIKSEIGKRPGGKRLLKIVKLPTTNFFSTILSYLHNLKVNSYPEEQLEEEFNSLVDDWEKSTKFIEKNELVKDVVKFCEDQVNGGNSRFFILTIYNEQIKIAEKSMVKLENFFEKKGYEVKQSKTGTKNLPMIEITITKKRDVI